MDLEKEIEELKKRIKMLETFFELKKKVDELEKQIEKSNPIYVPLIRYIPELCPYHFRYDIIWSGSDTNYKITT